ncbi:PTS mannitol transporter subunit IICB [Faecalicatena contorta]|uniref:PTS system mannitol-specific EIICB component n=1 Tax=Faecalicatena contorta TaxID=39482 RepID=A0A315ZVL4_9FIRM|nr:PTS mannitol transporter subunit IICB [Faecalicatena contorta]PWJ48980.1 PTS system mannitol-specific IIC component [Faecalicatena contorta]SUQ15070.1 PTS system, mannitol-specific IIC component [Faecalicatena contorta]
MGERGAIRTKVQKLGGFMSGMVMPNIGAFIAWGILTALFIPTGFFPNEKLSALVGPTLTYLLPLLIAYTAGYNMYERRGAIAGCLATVGVIIGANTTMLIGGMIMGPLGAWCVKKFDNLIKGKVKPGLEMLIDNFSMGIIGVILLVFGFLGVEPLISGLSNIFASGVDFLMNNNLLPLTSIFIAPGQALFLNNAINHGILTPLAIEQASEMGKSILFLLEANTGNWAGLILAFTVFGKGIAKKSAPTAAVIQIIGGIGEISVPYALMKPLTILGPILGGITGIFWLQLFDGGAVAAVSPGSIIALVLMSPKGKLLVNVSAYVAAAIVSFLVVSFILKRDKTVEEAAETVDIAGTDHQSQAAERGTEAAGSYSKRKIRKVAFCCDAGMGSSAMGASMLKTQLTKAGVYVDVEHASVHRIPKDIDVVITNTNLVDAARKAVSEDVPILALNEFLNGEEHKAIVKKIKDMME